MAKRGQSTKDVFGLLGSAPEDTYQQIGDFLTKEICGPTNHSLDAIGDRTLAKNLGTLLGPCDFFSVPAKDSKPGIKAKLQPWGVGDASRRGQWHAALAALQRYVASRPDDKKLRIGEAIVYLGQCAGSAGTISNQALTALVGWNLDEDISPGLEQELTNRLADQLRRQGHSDQAHRLRALPRFPGKRGASSFDGVRAAEALEAQGLHDLAPHFRHLPLTPAPLWEELCVTREMVSAIALQFSGYDSAKAEKLTNKLFD